MVKESQGEKRPFHLGQGQSGNVRESQVNFPWSWGNSTFVL